MMTLKVPSSEVNTVQGVPISVTGIAQVTKKHTTDPFLILCTLLCPTFFYLFKEYLCFSF